MATNELQKPTSERAAQVEDRLKAAVAQAVRDRLKAATK